MSNSERNVCYPCVSCCVWTEIAELAKPRGVPCRHLTDKGCGIYANRPLVCREFFCYPAEFDESL